MVHILFWISLGIWLFCDLYVLITRKRKKDQKKMGEHHSKYIMIFCICIGMFGGIVLFPSSREAFLLPFTPLRYLTFVFLWSGCLIRFISVHQLGKAFSIDVESTNGIGLYQDKFYGLIRHPSYLGELLCFLGVAIAFNHPITSTMAILFPFIAFGYRIYVEEAFLKEVYGNDYIQYAKKTKRFIPFVF